MKNLNLIFNKLYYEEPDENEKSMEKHFENKNAEIENAVFYHPSDFVSLPFEHQCFHLETTYPGLLLGLGNPHSTGKSTEEIKNGFSFDYVSGQPFIAGSSVKGLLRNLFKQYPEDVALIAGISETDLGALEEEIFEGADVFLDAVIFDSNENYKIIGIDYITPHSSPIENPVPISILKILPEVKWEFRFILFDGKFMTAQKKCDFFQELIKTFGIGAKTNVGYGVFEDCDDSFKKTEPRNEPTPSHQNANTSAEPKEGTMRKCPHCKRKNFKYRKKDGQITDTVTFSWKKNVCFYCGENLQ